MFKTPARKACILPALAALLIMALSSQVRAAEPFRDPSQPVDARVADLLSRLTLEEKAMLLNPAARASPDAARLETLGIQHPSQPTDRPLQS
jgi:beta-glucosidase